MAGRGNLPPSNFGPSLRRVREAKGWTQKQLGEAAELHPNTIAKLERGDQEPNWPLVLKMAEVLGVTCEVFNAGQVESPPVPEPPAPKKGKKK